jgi:alpha-galactosidase
MVAMLGNQEVIAVDQDELGKAASVVAGDPLDVLVKQLANGDRAVAIFNHGSASAAYRTGIDALGFAACSGCSYRIRDLWDRNPAADISGTLPSHATALYRVTQLR